MAVTQAGTVASYLLVVRESAIMLRLPLSQATSTVTMVQLDVAAAESESARDLGCWTHESEIAAARVY